MSDEAKPEQGEASIPDPLLTEGIPGMDAQSTQVEEDFRLASSFSRLADDLGAPLTIREEFALLQRAADKSDVRWIRLLVLELPSAFRAIAELRTSITQAVARLVIASTRFFLMSQMSGEVIPESSSTPVSDPKQEQNNQPNPVTPNP